MVFIAKERGEGVSIHLDTIVSSIPEDLHDQGLYLSGAYITETPKAGGAVGFECRGMTPIVMNFLLELSWT